MAIQFDNTNTGVVTLRPGTATDTITIGGSGNAANNTGAAVVGGDSNTASGFNAGIFSGDFNTASGQRSAVAGGQSNQATGSYSGLLAGQTNTANATVSGVFCGARGITRSIVGYILFSLLLKRPLLVPMVFNKLLYCFLVVKPQTQRQRFLEATQTLQPQPTKSSCPTTLLIISVVKL